MRGITDVPTKADHSWHAICLNYTVTANVPRNQRHITVPPSSISTCRNLAPKIRRARHSVTQYAAYGIVTLGIARKVMVADTQVRQLLERPEKPSITIRNAEEFKQREVKSLIHTLSSHRALFNSEINISLDSALNPPVLCLDPLTSTS